MFKNIFSRLRRSLSSVFAWGQKKLRKTGKLLYGFWAWFFVDEEEKKEIFAASLKSSQSFKAKDLRRVSGLSTKQLRIGRARTIERAIARQEKKLAQEIQKEAQFRRQEHLRVLTDNKDRFVQGFKKTINDARDLAENFVARGVAKVRLAWKARYRRLAAQIPALLLVVASYWPSSAKAGGFEITPSDMGGFVRQERVVKKRAPKPIIVKKEIPKLALPQTPKAVQAPVIVAVPEDETVFNPAIETKRPKSETKVKKIYADENMKTVFVTPKQEKTTHGQTSFGTGRATSLPIKEDLRKEVKEQALEVVSRETDGKKCISEDYGMRKNPITGHEEMHAAVDLPIAEGTSICAPISGKLSIEEREREGKTIYVLYVTNGKTRVGLHHVKPLFKKTKKGRSIVGAGNFVEKGAIIGIVSSKEPGTTGPHVHFLVEKKEGKEWMRLNPLEIACFREGVVLLKDKQTGRHLYAVLTEPGSAAANPLAVDSLKLWRTAAGAFVARLMPPAPTGSRVIAGNPFASYDKA